MSAVQDRSALAALAETSHRRTRITGIEIIEIRDGLVVRRWGEWDITEHGKD